MRSGTKRTSGRSGLTLWVVALVMAIIAGAAAHAGSSEASTSGGISGGHAPDLPGRSDPALARRAGTTSIGRNRLRRRLRKLSSRAPRSSGYLVLDLDSRRPVLFGRRADRRRKLASNQKLFTTATALDRLGADGRIATKVIQRGRLGPGGRLKGRLYLVGGGDPSLGAGDMKRLARRVRNSGIRRVTGGISADDTVFDRRRGVPDSGYGPSPYIAPLSGLTYAGSTYSTDPALAAADAFRGWLRKKGVKVNGGIRVRPLPAKLEDRRPRAQTHSAPISTLIAQTNKPSDNFFAEMLLKRLWATPDRVGTTRGGVRAVKRLARRLGSAVNAKDGSGLTGGNRASPREVARLLRGMRGHRDWVAFHDSLAVVGREGTVAYRMRGTAAQDRCRAKTGTIYGVSALSGYCSRGGHKLAFSLLMNGVSDTYGARSVQDRMVATIARYRP